MLSLDKNLQYDRISGYKYLSDDLKSLFKIFLDNLFYVNSTLTSDDFDKMTINYVREIAILGVNDTGNKYLKDLKYEALRNGEYEQIDEPLNSRNQLLLDNRDLLKYVNILKTEKEVKEYFRFTLKSLEDSYRCYRVNSDGYWRYL